MRFGRAIAVSVVFIGLTGCNLKIDVVSIGARYKTVLNLYSKNQTKDCNVDEIQGSLAGTPIPYFKDEAATGIVIGYDYLITKTTKPGVIWDCIQTDEISKVVTGSLFFQPSDIPSSFASATLSYDVKIIKSVNPDAGKSPIGGLSLGKSSSDYTGGEKVGASHFYDWQYEVYNNEEGQVQNANLIEKGKTYIAPYPLNPPSSSTGNPVWSASDGRHTVDVTKQVKAWKSAPQSFTGKTGFVFFPTDLGFAGKLSKAHVAHITNVELQLTVGATKSMPTK